MKTKKKKKKEEKSYKVFNTDIKYVMPMLPIEAGTMRTVENEVPDVIVTITQDSKTGDIKASAEGFQDKWFYAMFFDWLLYTKYVKKLEDIIVK